jgi:hypothetical protein
VRISRIAIVSFVLLAAAMPAAAQQRPLVTEDPETVGGGNILVEGGFDVQYDVFYPVSGLRGDLLRLPVLGVSFGLSSIAELQVDGGFYNRLNITAREPAALSHELNFTGDQTSDVEDLVVATKLRLLSETPQRPAFALRLATRLPNASNETGLGLDTMDFYVTGIVGKTVRSTRMVGNVGLGILGDPVLADRQGDALTYGFSLARAVAQGVEFVGEVNGRYAIESRFNRPHGTDSRAAMRFGGRITRGTVRGDAGVIIGLTSRDPTFGFTAGITWVFHAFTIP